MNVPIDRAMAKEELERIDDVLDSPKISIIDEVIEQLRAMPQHSQWQVLEFARTLVKAQVRGTPGQELLRFAGSIPPDDLQLMREAIKQSCEQVDINEW